MENTADLNTQSRLWGKFALAQGAMFDVKKKATDALVFSGNSDARSFVVPSKLEGTSRFQDNIRFARPRLDRVSRSLCAEVTPEGRVAVGFGMYTLGYVQKKHECWVRPLVEAGPCFFYLLQITGGTKGKPTCGVNIAIHNLPEAIQTYAARMDPESFARFVT